MDRGVGPSGVIPDWFQTDGCTGFPDVWRGIDLYPCCRAHDWAWFSKPGDWLAWFGSNVDLSVCFAQTGAIELAVPALVVTSTIGAALFALAKKTLFPRREH